MKLYRIKDWPDFYENARTRELKKLDFVYVPNKHDGDGFRTILGQTDGVAMFGAWIIILQVASKCSPRGVLIRDNGLAHDAETISRMTGCDKVILEKTLLFLSGTEVNWLEEVTSKRIAFKLPNSKGDIRSAHSVVQRHLKPNRGVFTPLGIMTQRPSSCQWCSETPKPCGRGTTPIVGHHLTGYGTLNNDKSVIFVCRSCHGKMENGHITNIDISERYGVDWMPKEIVVKSQASTTAKVVACDLSAAEGKGREENRKKEPTASAVFPFLENQEATKAWLDWQCHLKEKKVKTTSKAVEGQIEQCKVWGVARTIAALKHSVASNYQGLFEPKYGGLKATLVSPSKPLPGAAEYEPKGVLPQ